MQETRCLLDIVYAKKQDKREVAAMTLNISSYCRCYPIVISSPVQRFFVSQCLYLTCTVNILSYFTELKMRNIVFLGALALVSASDDQSCYAHISVSYIRGICLKKIFFYFRKILGEMRWARGRRLDHRDLQLCARRLQGQLRQPAQDHRGRLHRQHELPPHGEVPDLKINNVCKSHLHFSPLPSARTRWTGWGSVNTSRNRATRCGLRGRTWSSMSSRGAARWEQTFRFGLIYREWIWTFGAPLLLTFCRFLPWVLRTKLETSTTPMRWRRWELPWTCWRAGRRTPSPPTDTVCRRAWRFSIQR